MKTKIILALDVDNIKKAKYFINKLYPKIKIFKVGLQLFTICGSEIIEFIHKKGASAFLDLKFYDIPNTVKNAVEAAAKLNVFMLTVHASGGEEMLKAAASVINRPKIIGVTVLTSKSQEDAKDKVLELVKLSKDTGLDGVVCSVQEAAVVRKECGNDFIIITPGIRLQGSQANDQKRVATPREAIEAGANYIVVGRPILEAKRPLQVAEEILETIKEVESRK